MLLPPPEVVVFAAPTLIHSLFAVPPSFLPSPSFVATLLLLLRVGVGRQHGGSSVVVALLLLLLPLVPVTVLRLWPH